MNKKELKRFVIPAVYKDLSICNFIVYKDKSCGYWILEYKEDSYIKTLANTFIESIPIINLCLDNYGMITRIRQDVSQMYIPE
jgi:hypothetical protein